MQIEVRSDPFEGARAIKNRRAEPGSMRAHAHDRHIAFVPIILEKLTVFDQFVDRRIAASFRRAIVPIGRSLLSPSGQ